MKSSVFINLIFLLLHKQKTKYISIFISLQNEILKTLESHNDFIIQKEFGGRIFDIENQLEIFMELKISQREFMEDINF